MVKESSWVRTFAHSSWVAADNVNHGVVINSNLRLACNCSAYELELITLASCTIVNRLEDELCNNQAPYNVEVQKLVVASYVE